MTGTLFIVTAPSGAGKTSLVTKLVSDVPNLYASVSHTTRAPRSDEVHGLNYFFVSETEFQHMIKQEQFLEYAMVFDYHYGTSRLWVEQQLAAGVDIVLEIDWQGAQQIKQQCPQAISIYILPPSRSALHQRLQKRGQDTAKVISRRLQEAKADMSHYHEADYLVINDDFAQAFNQLKAIIVAKRVELIKQKQQYEILIKELLA